MEIAKTSTLLLVMREDGTLIYSFPRREEDERRRGLLSALISSIIALNREALGKVGDRISIKTDYGSFYFLRGSKAFYALMTKEQMNEEKIFSVLDHLAKGVDNLLPEGEIIIIDDNLIKSIEEIIREIFSPTELKDEEIKKLLQSLFRDIIEKTGKVPERLKAFVKEALFPVLVDRAIIIKEKNPMKRLILSQCTGSKDVEEISEMMGIPLERLMAELASYVRKGKIIYRVGYKLAYK